MIFTRWNTPTALTTPIYVTPTIRSIVFSIKSMMSRRMRLISMSLVFWTQNDGGLAQQAYVPAVSSKTPYAELAGAAIAGCSWEYPAELFAQDEITSGVGDAHERM